MQRSDAIDRLKAEAATLRARGAVGLYLFGSTARDRANEASDLDLFIDLDPDGDFSLVDLVALKRHLEERVGAPVDLTTRDALHPRLRPSIENSAVRIF